MKQVGMTMLEVLLVMAIASSFLLLGIKLFQQFSQERDMRVVQENVNAIFLGLKGYYQAHCAKNRDLYSNYPTATSISPGDLDPVVVGTAAIYYPVSVANLINGGFLPQSLPPSNIASNYITQFNAIKSTHSVNFCYHNPQTDLVTCSAPDPIKASNTVYLLRAQVAVQVSGNASQVAYYQKRLGADCISDVSGSFVTPCVSSAGTGNYIVFERLPSLAVPEAASTSEIFMPNVLQFKRQYTNDDNYAVNVDDPVYNGANEYENYLCGG